MLFHCIFKTYFQIYIIYCISHSNFLVLSFSIYLSILFLHYKLSIIYVKIVNGGLGFYFLFSLYFIFCFLFLLFSIFRTTQVKIYQSRCHISHKLMAKSQD